MRPWFKEKEFPLPETILVSVGFPKYGSSKAIGQCWDAETSMGELKAPHIFIHPNQINEVRILDILLHELIHAAVGCKHGHKGPFKRLALEFGLAGKMTATFAEIGSEIYNELLKIAEELGPFPHIGLQPPVKQKVPAKWVRLKSPMNEEYKVVISPSSIDAFGFPIDPWGNVMIPNKGE